MPLLHELFSRRWRWKTLFALLAAAVCVRLGVWQLDRLAQRRAFNAHYLAMRAAPPLVLTGQALATDLMAMEYRSVRVSGRYDFARQMLVLNQYREGEPGYRLVTPLVLDDGVAVLVDRGWIPLMEHPTADVLQKYDAPQRVTVTGIIRRGEQPPAWGGVADRPLERGEAWRLRWRFLDPMLMQPQLPYSVLPVYIQAAGVEGPPWPQIAEIELTEGPHMGYAIQWFLFAALCLFAYPVMVWRQTQQEDAFETSQV